MTDIIQTPETNTPALPKSKRRKIMTVLAVIFIVIALLYLLYWLIWGRFEVNTDDAYVNGNVVSLMPQVSGTVAEIFTDDTQLVRTGQTLIKLDGADATIAYENARANLSDTVRQVKQYFANAKRAQANLVIRKADYVKAKLDLGRRVGLVTEKAVSREEIQHYQTALAAAKAVYDSALYELEASYGLVENTHLYTHPLVEKAKAAFKQAYLNLARTTIQSPLTGFVAKRNVQVGQEVNPATPLLAIVPLYDVWVDANYKESQLDSLRIGQPVHLTADAYPGVTYHGRIMGLNAGTGAAFAILPPQNATGNWIKIVQRLPVRIVLDKKEIEKNPLQIGLSMQVSTDISDLSGLRLANVANTKLLYSTDIYARQLATVNKLIEQILRENAENLYLPPLSVAKGAA